jgi:transposase-like protein
VRKFAPSDQQNRSLQQRATRRKKGTPLAQELVGTTKWSSHGKPGQKMPILPVIGIRTDGQREVLAFTVGERENQTAREDRLQNLKDRGVQQVDLWITDGNQAMLNALVLKLLDTPRQRCALHKMKKVLSYIPERQEAQVEPELKALFYQENREKADQAVAAFCLKYEKIYPTAVGCLQRDLQACLTFYAFPRAHWRTIRSPNYGLATNVIEQLFEEVKRRSHKMGAAFGNETSCLLMFYAVVRTLKFHRVAMPNS